jgi:DNA repair protein RecN (Recombination protein N)
MLRDLRIQNFALIDQIHLTFGPSLNVLTGETGAGKSILIDAVTMILGGRSSPELIRSGCEEAVVEAAFVVDGTSPAVAQLRAMEYEFDDEIVIQRTLTSTGKGRAYLNGRPVTITMLAQVTGHLVDLHGQHDHQSLLRAETPLNLLDAYGRHDDLLDPYVKTWSEWSGLQRMLEESEARAATRARELSLLEHEATELERAAVQPGEAEALERERAVLGQSERLASITRRAYERLHQDEGCVLGEIRTICGELDGAAKVDDRLAEAVDLARSGLVQLQEMAERLRAYSDGLTHDEGRLETIEARLHELQRLRRKYGVSADDLLGLLATKQVARRALQDEAENTLSVAAHVQEQRVRLEVLATQLHERRVSIAARMETAVDAELTRLRMTARFEVVIETADPPDALGPKGRDRVEFFIRANPGEPSKPLRKTASGGELSRLMLALKTVLAQVDQVPTLIFDEVDTGVGGAVAEVVGRRLQAIAAHRQVFCVTHLPQVASGAQTHVLVEKSIQGGRTMTRARRLAPKERVREIARMLAGEAVTPTALRHAEEMIRLVSSLPPERAVEPRTRPSANG